MIDRKLLDAETASWISRIDSRQEFVIFEDGYTYYWPNNGGALTAHNLRQIADELDRRNAPVGELYRRSLDGDAERDPG